MATFRLKQQVCIRATVTLAAMAVIGLGLSAIWPGPVMPLVTAVATALLLIAQSRVGRALEERFHRNRWLPADQRAMIRPLIKMLRPIRPLPPFTCWTITPREAHCLVSMTRDRKPRLVVECGSGLSTLLLGYAMKRFGAGRVISVEHDPIFAGRTRELVNAHGLADVVQVVQAELMTSTLRDKSWQWYDTGRLPIDDPIDLLFVDGPPGHLQPLSRYPAGPCLFDRLATRGLVVLDDALRDDEAVIVENWLKEFAQMKRLDDPDSQIPPRLAVLERAV